jgi:MoxR-like ATPase
VSDIQSMQQKLGRVLQVTAERMVGQSLVTRHAFAACLAGGHVLFEDVPGTGKTTLALTLAQTLGLTFRRIQGAPDLLPSDVTGTMILQPGTGTFEFRPGPVFTQLLLMDEINRATPRAQSALLEAMAERQVSVDGEAKSLPRPFFVLATANPVESQGVFPLPEAQLDRFLVQLKLGYVTETEEIEMVRRQESGRGGIVSSVMTADELILAQQLLSKVTIADDVLQYLVRMCRKTRERSDVMLGASPRAVIALTKFSQALAMLENRDFVTPDDVREAWFPVLRHRLRLESWDIDRGSVAAEKILQQVLDAEPVPSEFVEAK